MTIDDVYVLLLELSGSGGVTCVVYVQSRLPSPRSSPGI